MAIREDSALTGDTDCSGKVNSDDVIRIVKIVAKLI